MVRALILVLLLVPAATAAQAWERVTTADGLMARLSDKRLTHLLYTLSLTVGADGTIAGEALGWDVSGEWTWERGFFCRTLYWGGDDLGYNCQLVEARGDEMRFTSDQGAGRSASFRLRD